MKESLYMLRCASITWGPGRLVSYNCDCAVGLCAGLGGKMYLN